jgi:hypothetical protein
MSPREGRGPERPGPDYPPEWDTEPIDEPDPRDEHDQWHPVWVEGCDGCIDRADYLEGAIVRTMHLVPPSADEVRIATGLDP